MFWESELIAWLQQFSSPPLNLFFYLITLLGERGFFIIILALIYWCIDKEFGFAFFNVYLLGSVANEGVKYIFKRPRPYIKYDGKIRSIITKTGGYSFPSGHSQSISNISTQTIIYVDKRKNRIRYGIICFLIVFLVMLSRIYLGQHYITDVLAGCVSGTIYALLFGKFYQSVIYKFRYKIYCYLLPIGILLALFFTFFGSRNFISAVEVCGALAGFSSGFALEHKYVNYNPRSDKYFKYILKCFMGFAILSVIKLLFDSLIALSRDSFILNMSVGFISYFVFTLWISFFAPLCFSEIHI